MLSVLHVGTALGYRGGEQQLFFLLRGLKERGETTPAALPEHGLLAHRAREAGIAVLPLRARGDLDLRAAATLRGYVRRHRPQILHLHTARAHAIGRLALAGLANRPKTVVSRQVSFPTRGGPLRRLKYVHGIDRYVAVSRSAALSVLRAGVPPDRVTVVPCGVDLAVFQVPRDREGLKQELAIRDTAKLVGLTGALEEGKGPGDVLEAVAGLSPDVHVLLTGEGTLRDALERRSRRGDLAGRVHFLGWREDFPRVLRSLDVLCLPSRQEGFPNAILDALAAEVPVIATRVGGVPEMLESGVDGLLVEPANPPALREALSRILDDPSLGAALAARGGRTIQRFTADRMVERTLAVYQDVLTGRRGPGVSGREGASSC
ncbi:MAG TPA: glycosyltransferase [Candidatus Eisenbacteria bacterium]|nr:glycosyltransferase [Candidatus Eisenbacteria bacterium]